MQKRLALGVVVVWVLAGCGGGSTPAPDPPAISVTASPATASVQTGLTQVFTATVANDSANKGVTWALSGSGCSGAACGSLSAASSATGVGVTYTAPASVPNPASITLTATSVADGTKSATAAITLTAAPAITVTLSSTTASVVPGANANFTATLANDSANKGVTWTLSGTGCSGAACGILSAASSASGVAVTYTAPAAVPAPPTVTLTATSGADTTKTASATITVASSIAVTLSSTATSVAVGANANISATVANDSANKGVTWTLSGTGCSAATCGALSAATTASGVAVTYTAPVAVPSPPTVTLTATSVADATKTASATITVALSGTTIGVTVTPKRGGLTLGQSLNFSAAVSNDVGGAGVTWSATTGTFSATTVTTATYVAPNSPGSITVTATSVADGTKTATATIGVTDLAGVTTYHNDLARDGANVQEYALTTSSVASGTFGKLFSCTVDGAVYAQPLWVPNVNIGGGTHNVVVVATMRDSVYVFDADASPCTKYWGTQFLPPGETYVNFNDYSFQGDNTEDIYPDIGITGTPVIDPSTNTIYFVAKTKTSSGTVTAHQRLYAVSLTTGQNATGSPVDISVSVPGNCDGGTAVAFNPLMQNQRPGLALHNGTVYVGWGSHGDVGNWHGWLMGFQTANLGARPSVFNTTPNGLATPVGGNAPPCGGGIWMSGGAPAIDSGNNLYALSGNGAWDNTIGDYSDSYVKLATPGLTVSDWFTPSNQLTLDQNDTDLGSSGTAVLIDQTGGKHLLVGASKGGVFFVLNRDNLGHFNAGGDSIVQEFNLDGRSFSTPGSWNNTVYFFGVNFKAGLAGETFPFDPSLTLPFNPTPAQHTAATFGFPGATPSISASSATTDGIVWAIDNSAFGLSDSTFNNPNKPAPPAGPAILHAFDASDVSKELWNSAQASGGRDTAGNSVKFTVPTVANGKVYIGTRGSDDTLGGGTTFGEIDVYGLLPN